MLMIATALATPLDQVFPQGIRANDSNSVSYSVRPGVSSRDTC